MKFYAYVVPRKGLQGVSETWKGCEALVRGEPEARFKSFRTRDAAHAWLGAGGRYEDKTVVAKGIYFDAGTGRGEGVEIKVTDEKGVALLPEIMPKGQMSIRGTHTIAREVSNNYGELLACKYALMLAMKTGAKNVFGDSRLVLDYWSKGYIKKETLPRETLSLAYEIAALRKKFESEGGILRHISGDDNPADLGFHRR